jgi:hypothetical protein
MADKPKNLTLSGIINDLTFSEEEVWLWVKLPPMQYEFLTFEEREGLARTLDLSLANLIQSDDKAVQAHLIVSSQPFDTARWATNLWERTKKNNPHPYFRDFLYGMHDRIEQVGFEEKLVMLGVKIGDRYEYSPIKTAINLGAFNTIINKIAGVKDKYLSDKEYNFWNARANNFRNSLYSSRARMQPVTAGEIAFMIRKNFFPEMPVPSLNDLNIGNDNAWGEGELSALVDAEVENYSKFLKITQFINGKPVIGYRATLCFSKFPEIMLFPEREPWIHYAGMTGFPVGFYSRFNIEPSRKVSKEVGKKMKEVRDQAYNQTGAGGDVTMDVMENLQLGEQLDYALKKDNTPWVFGRHRLVVEASSEEELREKVQIVIDHYKAMDILVVWPTGDQMALLLESMPSDRVRVKSYHQNQELSIIGAGVPAGSGSTGDQIMYKNDGTPLGWVGPYLGYTTSRVQEPVFLSVHSAIAKNNPPGLVITGSPGGGKSFTAFTLTYQMALAGIWTIYIDPKGDALPMANLPGMEESKVFDLRQGNDGMLDPFSIGQSDSEKVGLALETIGLFMGGQSKISPQQNVQLSTILKRVASQPNPSLNKVVDELMAADNDDAKGLGATLDLIRDLPFARLCFAEKVGEALRPDEGLTIVTLLGLDLPSSVTPPESYSNSNKLAVAVMYLLASFTRELMMSLNKSHPKAIVIDEAWAITSTPQGAKLIFEVARMGRSLNTGLILVSQNAGDFLGEGVTNSIATKLAFRAKQPEEIENVLRFFNLEPHEGNKDVIRELRNGECIIQDVDGRIAIVQVDGWNQEMNYAFETNPETRKTK